MSVDTQGDDDTGGETWPFTRSVALIGDPIAQGLAFTLVVSILFLAFPGIDLWFSGLFYKAGTGFPMSGLGAFTALRGLGGKLILMPALAMLAVVVIKILLPTHRSLARPRDMLFAISTLIIGPGIIVNGIFKANWGRPRPIHVEEFGGNLPFTGVWDITDYCQGNCSFVSGEASSALWLITLTMFVPARWRPAAVKAVLVLIVLLSFNRIAFGGHFLSDVLISWGMTLTVIAVTHRFLYVRPPAALTNERLEEGLTAFGLALRRGFRRTD